MEESILKVHLRWLKMVQIYLVCGTSTIFRPHEGTLTEVTKRYRQKLDSELL